MKILDQFLVIGLDLLIRAGRCAVEDLVVFIQVLEIDPLYVFELWVADPEDILYFPEGGLFRRVQGAVGCCEPEQEVEKRDQDRGLILQGPWERR